METSKKSQFVNDFYTAIRSDKESIRQELIKNGEFSAYNNIKYKSLVPSIAYIFIMTDEELLSKISDCVKNGYATKLEVCRLFKVKQHVMSSRITIAHNESLRIYWRELIESMADTYPLANPEFLNSTEINENGDVVECGYVSAVKKFASRGFTKKEICEQLEINPASWSAFPVLEQSYNQGVVEFQSAKSDSIIEAVSQHFIRNNYFIEVIIPAIQKEAFEHQVELTEKIYSINEDGERILRKEKVKTVNVPGNKDMRELALRLASGNLLDSVNFGKDKESKVKAIPMFKSELITDKGTFEIKQSDIEDAEYEPAE